MKLSDAFQLALAHQHAARFADADRICRQILAAHPNHSDTLNLLGIIATQTARHDNAVAFYRAATIADPKFAEAHNNLGNALVETGQVDLAIASFKSAVQLNPDYSQALYHLGSALAEKGDLDSAITFYTRSLAIMPDFLDAHLNLGNALKDTGRLDDALASYRRAMDIQPAFHPAHSNLIAALQYHPDTTPQSLLAETRHWNARHAAPLTAAAQSPTAPPHANGRNPNRKLRIGYVSADFQNHASMFFLQPLLAAHDHAEFEIYCYAQIPKPDAVTQRFQSLADHWRSTVGLSPADIAAAVRADRIDILVDLKLHTADNRLLAFAHKPAPIQVTWLGYPGTTGLDAIDYRLTDPHMDPPGQNDADYAEKSIRLPDTFWCYAPLAAEPPSQSPPSEKTGRITFGSLNNFCKINGNVLTAWAAIMQQLPQSHLLLLAPEGSCRRRVLDHFSAAGISSDRIEFAPRQSRADYLQLYHRIDITLDTFPYNGHTTSLDSLWMSVPVITQTGPTAVNRAGLSQLTNLNLPDLIAHSPEEYIQRAVTLATTPARLTDLHATLRQRMESSPLMNAAKFTKGIEEAYRAMWHTWCHPIPS